MVDTADRILSNLRDLPDSIDNIDAAIVQIMAEPSRCATRGSRTRESAVCRRSVEKAPMSKIWMSKIWKAAAAAALAASVTSLWVVTAGRPAAAEEQGTEQDRQVCTADVFRLCDAFIPDPKRITVCLQQNIRNLSPACEVVINGSVQR